MAPLAVEVMGIPAVGVNHGPLACQKHPANFSGIVFGGSRLSYRCLQLSLLHEKTHDEVA